MALHAISVFDKVWKWSPETFVLLNASLHVSVSQEWKIHKWPDLSYSFSPIDCCVRIKGKPDPLLNDDIQSWIDFYESDYINFKTFAFLAV